MLHLPDLRLGQLLAEGGEGRVFELAADPAGTGASTPATLAPSTRRVFKQFRRARSLDEVQALVGYPALLASASPGASARVVSSAAWPVEVVAGDSGDEAAGVVLPRAPANFWLAHREGPLRLATLSYLASDPDRIELAYGVAMPAPGSAQRVAVVYALARLLDAWQGPWAGTRAAPELGPVAHGDLSAKNILWSLQPVPAVFVLDCDGARGPGSQPGSQGPGPEGYSSEGPGSEGPGVPEAPRPITPNWEDPAVAAGQAPGTSSDRYALALVFLRVLGGAHFPLQARQRTGQPVSIDLELPRSWRRLPDMPALWQLCEQSLSVVGAADRPPPRLWCAQLEALLDELGAANLAHAVRDAQHDPVAAGPLTPAEAGRRGAGAEVVVRPVLRTRQPSTWQLISAQPPLVGPRGELVVSAPAYRSPVGARQLARQGLSMWGRAHRLAARMLRSPGRRGFGLRRLAGMVVVDIAAACVGLFVVGMVVSPWIGL